MVHVPYLLVEDNDKKGSDGRHVLLAHADAAANNTGFLLKCATEVGEKGS